MDPIFLDSIRGGLNNEDPLTAVGDDQVVICENVDLDRSTLGGRRLGHLAITTSGINTKTVFAFRHIPGNTLPDAELWAVSTSGTSSVWARKTTAWSVVTPTGSNALDVAEGQYAIRAASHGGKLFLCYPTVSGTDRMHVWDGTSIRVTGLAEPAAPSVATAGGSGDYSTTRYFRVRYTKQSGGVTLLRSEPSTSTEFVPNGNDTGAVVTKPAAINEGETHWEVEESINNVEFYRIATVAVGTTTYTDSLTPSGVTTTGVLSADIGDFSLQWSAKFVLVDEDRVLIAGAWENTDYGSRVGWTPVGLAPGINIYGNDERMEEDTDPFLDLDNKDGGEITDFAGPLFGYIYVFKYQRIYKLVRTKSRQQAYTAVPITAAFGALPNTVIGGMDQFGRPCLYFLDPYNGPCRIGANGIERCGYDVLGTWRTVNLQATVPARGVYYPEKERAYFYVATGSSSFPNLRLGLHTRYQKAAPEGLRGGWTTADGTLAAGALTTCLFSVNVNDNTSRSHFLKPIIGVSGSPLIAMTDTGTTDNGTGYAARFRTGARAPFNFVKQFRVRAGALVCTPVVSGELRITLNRNYSLETLSKDYSIVAAGSEEVLVKVLDNLFLSNLFAVQVEIGDPGNDDTDWVVDSLSLYLEPEERI